MSVLCAKCSESRKTEHLIQLRVKGDFFDETLGLYHLIMSITRNEGFGEFSWTFRNDWMKVYINVHNYYLPTSSNKRKKEKETTEGTRLKGIFIHLTKEVISAHISMYAFPWHLRTPTVALQVSLLYLVPDSFNT